MGLMTLGSVDLLSEEDVKRLMKESEGLHVEEEWQTAWDDATGNALRPDLARCAREEEIEYFRKMEVYFKVPSSECVKATEEKPIGARWVDINKQDEPNPKYRSRLMAKEIKKSPMPELYTATPPLECLRMVLSSLMDQCDTDKIDKQKEVKRMACDVSGLISMHFP